MRALYFPVLVLGFVLLQFTALNFIAINGVKPDLVLILVILNGFFLGTREGAFWGFIGGILQDLIGGGYFGLYALTGMAAGYLGGLAEGRLYRESRLIGAGLVGACTFGAQLLFYLLLLLLNVRVSLLHALTGVIGPVSVYNALVALICYGLFYRLRRSGLLGDGYF
ncbi:MAG: rod shape-determining protein MreD [Firmicutes bacterium]|nr:rod shape-determining protein MreD [Bacillota bacterium]